METTHPRGIVKSINSQKVIVTFSRSSACGNCDACGLLKETGEMFLEFESYNNVKVGDPVNVHVDESFFLVSALLLYGLPLLVLLVGVGLASIVFNEGYYQVIAAVIGLALSAGTYFFLKRYDSYFSRLKKRYMKYTPVDTNN